MPTDDSRTSAPSRSAAASHAWLVALLVGVALIVAIGILVMFRDGDSEPPAAAGSLPSIETTTKTTVLSVRSEVSSRLREIMRIRDIALLSRDASLLREIYAVDCPCLSDGRTLIGQLRKENIVWKGLRTDIVIMNLEEVNERLWIVVAKVQTPSVRIETESGRLIRMVPAEHNTVRFALTRPQAKEEWLLGHASNLG